MKNMTLETIAACCNGILHNGQQDKKEEITSITTDSRKVEAGCLFVPIVGERADGHDFIPTVMEQQAAGTLSERELPGVSFPYIQVDSSLKAVKDIAAFYLQQLQIPVVGITGSVGKTSTKECIASVLGQKYRTLKTLGNFNNELGLPLTVFRLRQEDQIAVLEMGISDFGEMSRLAAIARPDTCVITNIGPCHLEFLGDRDGVLRAKTEIFQYMKEDGTAILNGDDDKLSTVKEVQGKSPVFFGMSPNNTYYADAVKNLGLKGTSCDLHMDTEVIHVTIPIPGRHMVYNALAAAAVGKNYGLTGEEIKKGIESQESLSGRFHMIETEKYLIVDDCYNANPVSMKASLDVLQDGLGRKVAILGDMGELGADEKQLHQEVGAYAAGKDIDVLICVGELCQHMAKACEDKTDRVKICYEPNVEELKNHLAEYVRKGDTILVKASHFMHFEQVVDVLKAL